MKYILPYLSPPSLSDGKWKTIKSDAGLSDGLLVSTATGEGREKKQAACHTGRS